MCGGRARFRLPAGHTAEPAARNVQDRRFLSFRRRAFEFCVRRRHLFFGGLSAADAAVFQAPFVFFIPRFGCFGALWISPVPKDTVAYAPLFFGCYSTSTHFIVLRCSIDVRGSLRYGKHCSDDCNQKDTSARAKKIPTDPRRPTNRVSGLCRIRGD